MPKLATFDAADYLDYDETFAQYLTGAFEYPNPDVFLAAVRDVARTHGMAKFATDVGLGRESLYKAPLPGGKLVVPCEALSVFAARPVSFDVHRHDGSLRHVRINRATTQTARPVDIFATSEPRHA